jgi:hypothetical protein
MLFEKMAEERGNMQDFVSINYIMLSSLTTSDFD